MSLEEAIRETVRKAVADALVDLELPEPEPTEEEGWPSRVHRVHPDTRLTLTEIGEALGVSERSVRRYIAGEGDYPPLPATRGPAGTTVRAGDLVEWIEDVEGANRFRRAAR